MKAQTLTKLARLQNQMEGYAGEPVTIEEINGSYYVYGSELATLRIYRRYEDCNNVRQDYSGNLKTFYFVID